jgi:acyl-CoA reductase-like NAD-dependent aldehyde dehydrogenase
MELVVDAGFPPGVVNVVIGGPDIGDALATHRAVAKIAFTGQTATGRQILRAAADRLTPVSLELGGKSPNIVFADGDLGAATGGVFGGIFFNQGQACVAGSRLLVEASVADRVVEDVVARAGRIRLGDGFDPDTTMGPVISAAHRGGILSMIDGAVADGAEVAIGGRPGAVDGLDGYFVEPTVLTGVTSAMNVAQEEVFGPVLSVLPWEDPDELVALANDVPYGIAAGIWTADVARALRIAQDLEVGTVWINTYGMFDVAVPFGGRKQSGTGRELGKSALDPYLVSKSIWVDLQPAAQTAGQAVAR